MDTRRVRQGKTGGEEAGDRVNAADREAIVRALEDRLREGARELVGNRGYRRFLRVEKDALTVDAKKIEAEARYDGKFVLRTNTTLPADEVAIRPGEHANLTNQASLSYDGSRKECANYPTALPHLVPA